jgi:SAM-dependent methyltransferase
VVEAPANLANVEFWDEDHHRHVQLPSRPDDAFAYERCLARSLEELAPVAREQTVLEVGCAPARWLVWYAERFGARVTGIEYTARGAELSRQNLAATGVGGSIHQGDFFSADFDPGPFDLVLSLGFIEHFQDLASAFDRHLTFVKPGGRLLIGVPNFRGLIGVLQRWGDPSYLALHNQAAMDPSLYRKLAEASNLRVDAVSYIDGPDPAMLRVSRRSAHAVVLPLSLVRRVGLVDRMNGRLISSYLVVAFTRV